MPKNIVTTIGEVMLRLTCPDNLRFLQTSSLLESFAGSEANVAVNLSNWGQPSSLITSVPNNSLGIKLKQNLRQHGVDTSWIIENTDGRMGLIFVEPGNNFRSSKVIYDRANSSFSKTLFSNSFFNDILENTKWLHWSGITPSLSIQAFENCKRLLKLAKDANITISTDLNYRQNLMKGNDLVINQINELVCFTDYLIGNEEDYQKILILDIPYIDYSNTQKSLSIYENICLKTKEKFPNLKNIAITLRTSLSADHNLWSSILYDGNSYYYSKNYEIKNIVDRIGAGDAFSSGLVYGIINFEGDLQKSLDFATAAACLKHSVFGDYCLISKEEILGLISGNKLGRIER